MQNILFQHQCFKENVLFKTKLSLLTNTKATKVVRFCNGLFFSHNLYHVNFADIPSHLFVLIARGSSEHISMLTNKLVGWSAGQPLTTTVQPDPYSSQPRWESSFSGCCLKLVVYSFSCAHPDCSFVWI